MFTKFKIAFICLIYLFANVFVFTDGQEASYFERFNNLILSNFVDRIVNSLGDGLFDESEPPVYKYNHLHQHKFLSPVSLEKCIKLHDSEIVSPDFKRLNGRWDRHLISIPFPEEYDYGLTEYDEKEKILDFKYEPWGYMSHKALRNGTKMIRSNMVINNFLGVKLQLDEALMATDYTSYFIKYTCVEVFGKVSNSLHFQLRPEASAQLETNPALFTQILDSIPDKTINKIAHLIIKLNHQKDKRFEGFGKTYEKSLTQRLDKYRNNNQLSDKSDDNVYEFLDYNCLNFNQDELKPFDMSTVIESSNSKLEYTDMSMEKLVFNQMTVQSKTENTFAVKLFNGEKHIADSDLYYDQNRNSFFAYTEGRRSLEITVVSTPEHRLVYSCEERHINGKLQMIEILRYFSHESNSKGKDVRPLDSVLTPIKQNLQSKNLQKLEELVKNMVPLLKREDTPPRHEDL